MLEAETDLIALQEKLAHHEKMIEDLSEQLARQWSVITEMESRFQGLAQRFVALEETQGSENEVPPHY